MSLYNVAKRLTGKIQGISQLEAQDAVAEALEEFYRQTDWSFQKSFIGAWLAPGIVLSTGTFTCTQYSNTVIADATATAALAAYSGQPFITQLQFRNLAYSIYNIVGYDTTTNAPFATLTLDRPWTEPIQGPGISYAIYQCYFVAPSPTFNKFVEITDVTNDQALNYWGKTQGMLAVEDPQRSNFSIPEYVVPFGVDQRPGSSTLGYPMFELWPHQGNICPYNFGYRTLGPLPQTPADFLSMSTPYPITEKMVEWRAREVLCLDAEARKGQQVGRGSGPNWILLAQMAQKEYTFMLGQAIAIDLNLDGEAFTRVGKSSAYNSGEGYATMNGGLNLGRYPEN